MNRPVLRLREATHCFRTKPTMHAQQPPFEDLQLSAAHHDDRDAAPTAGSLLLHMRESASQRHSREPINADVEIAKLVTFFVKHSTRHAAQNSAVGPMSANALAVALPPPVRYCRASRKAVANLLA